MSTISPGCRPPRTRLTIFAVVMPPEVPSQPRVSTVQPTGTNPAEFTTDTVCAL